MSKEKKVVIVLLFWPLRWRKQAFMEQVMIATASSGLKMF